jgi:hypothetical protein
LFTCQSVLENHHAATTFRLLYQSDNNFLCNLSREQKAKIRATVVKGILGTDIAGMCCLHGGLLCHPCLLVLFSEHASVMNTLAKITSERTLSRDNPEDRILLVKTIVHTADLSNPALPRSIARKWADLVAQEFRAQVPLSTICLFFYLFYRVSVEKIGHLLTHDGGFVFVWGSGCSRKRKEAACDFLHGHGGKGSRGEGGDEYQIH